ncbi:hypothetical protein C356_05313 [Cryptococcus neoformans c45]|nr:hypothetical protein C356_05313 [Cryptococcus neoformans var. grubii c45]
MLRVALLRSITPGYSLSWANQWSLTSRPWTSRAVSLRTQAFLTDSSGTTNVFSPRHTSSMLWSVYECIRKETIIQSNGICEKHQPPNSHATNGFIPNPPSPQPGSHFLVHPTQ